MPDQLSKEFLDGWKAGTYNVQLLMFPDLGRRLMLRFIAENILELRELEFVENRERVLGRTAAYLASIGG